MRLGKQGGRVGCESLVLQFLATPRDAAEFDARLKEPALRIGYTVTKKQGNAVLRNRVKRRLRAAARAVMPGSAKAGIDYVLVGKTVTATCDYATILRDFAYALRRSEKPRTVNPQREGGRAHAANPR